MRFRRSYPMCRALAGLSAFVFLASIGDLALLATPAFADAREELTKADDYFQVADFATALAKVDALLDSGDLQGGTLRDAYVLKARCEVALAHRSSAVDAFCSALRVEPGWRPDPDLYTKDEIEVFDQARENCAATPTEPEKPQDPAKPADRPSPFATAAPAAGKAWYKKPVFMAVGGAVLVGGVIALAGGGGGDGDSDLPGFPNPPQ